jgi:hypothetical protein
LLLNAVELLRFLNPPCPEENIKVALKKAPNPLKGAKDKD